MGKEGRKSRKESLCLISLFLDLSDLRSTWSTRCDCELGLHNLKKTLLRKSLLAVFRYLIKLYREGRDRLSLKIG